jgi:peptide/nickel transport system permease protein
VGTWGYIGKKILQALFTLLFILVFNFFLFRMLANPIDMYAKSAKLSAVQKQEEIHQQGLDKPKIEQFFIYVKNTFTGTFGFSYQTGEPVTAMIARAFWPTILLVGVSTFLSTAIGLLMGIHGGWRRGSRFDVGQQQISLLFYSMPEWWLGLMFLILFTSTLHLFPSGGIEQLNPPLTGWAHVVDVLNHMFLPVLTLTLAYLGEYSIIMRASLLDVLREDFVTTARAKGLREHDVLWDHAVPNALLPTVTLVVLNFAFVLGGAITVETVFTWPGLGLLTYDAISNSDYPVLQVVFLLLSAAVIFANLFADLLYPYLDPRVKES